MDRLPAPWRAPPPPATPADIDFEMEDCADLVPTTSREICSNGKGRPGSGSSAITTSSAGTGNLAPTRSQLGLVCDPPSPIHIWVTALGSTASADCFIANHGPRPVRFKVLHHAIHQGWELDYTKMALLHPGQRQRIRIKFAPTTWLEHTDEFSVEADDGQRLIITLCASPAPLAPPPSIQPHELVVCLGSNGHGHTSTTHIYLENPTPRTFTAHCTLLAPDTPFRIKDSKIQLTGNSAQELVVALRAPKKLRNRSPVMHPRESPTFDFKDTLVIDYKPNGPLYHVELTGQVIGPVSPLATSRRPGIPSGIPQRQANKQVVRASMPVPRELPSFLEVWKQQRDEMANAGSSKSSTGPWIEYHGIDPTAAAAAVAPGDLPAIVQAPPTPNSEHASRPASAAKSTITVDSETTTADHQPLTVRLDPAFIAQEFGALAVDAPVRPHAAAAAQVFRLACRARLANAIATVVARVRADRQLSAMRAARRETRTAPLTHRADSAAAGLVSLPGPVDNSSSMEDGPERVGRDAECGAPLGSSAALPSTVAVWLSEMDLVGTWPPPVVPDTVPDASTGGNDPSGASAAAADGTSAGAGLDGPGGAAGAGGEGGLSGPPGTSSSAPGSAAASKSRGSAGTATNSAKRGGGTPGKPTADGLRSAAGTPTPAEKTPKRTSAPAARTISSPAKPAKSAAAAAPS
ncbi:hypothetical protein BC828DRAFT_394140 [Blastocladiella britannica]|nr:hypothetical protein BC828DRAFT_394140 [Blastocladiella britannica]